MKTYSEACERNKLPILSVIKPLLKKKQCLLEVGSGTGQHAVYFAENLKHLTWQTSDRKESHSSICEWIEDACLDNVYPPLLLDVLETSWPKQSFDAVFSANTVHIMSWEAVKCFFKGVSKTLVSEGIFILYGPFNYDGEFSSDSNRQFESWLKSVDPKRGIRDFEAVNRLAKQNGLALINDYEMPANNRILLWKKDECFYGKS